MEPGEASGWHAVCCQSGGMRRTRTRARATCQAKNSLRVQSTSSSGSCWSSSTSSRRLPHRLRHGEERAGDNVSSWRGRGRRESWAGRQRWRYPTSRRFHMRRGRSRVGAGGGRRWVGYLDLLLQGEGCRRTLLHIFQVAQGQQGEDGASGLLTLADGDGICYDHMLQGRLPDAI
eukprot:754753-Hanusia_phi.AAC.5